MKLQNIPALAIIFALTGIFNAVPATGNQPSPGVADSLPDADSTSNYFMHQKNYIPGQPLNQSIKTIYLAFNVWQKDDGSGTFEESEFLDGQLRLIVENINNIFAISTPPVRPIEGVEYLKDSHIRFELKNISYYRNSAFLEVNCNSGNKLNSYVFQKSPENREYLNIHLTTGSCLGAKGYAIYPSERNMNSDGYVVTFIKNEPGNDKNYAFWSLAMHLAHELGHNLDLLHPYDSEYCKFSHPDFLFDLFGYERQEWCTNPRFNCDVCYHQGGWSCKLTDPTTTCTNNLMGGNMDMNSITPLQMGRMNRALQLSSVRKYAWGYSPVPYQVHNDQVWPFNIKLYQDLHIAAGKTLTVKGTVEMVPQARIIVEPGARLIIDAGRVTSAMYSHAQWEGPELIKPERKWYSFLFKKVSPGKVELLNDGVITNYKEE